ncbi:GNAT family N-acetyltransferase [Spirosoma sp. HMF4905]|uniref:GNAT family N-acetyltransferase n=1 Tax=Spirosoma arboris TaxID=2682092 RepID=A0A7K1SCN4_9BACT|nr:GNAT family N-acetyltransferase [Spirosoma arboris]MVM31428.1 GNAT family N-acetyltransferase [Spirosoma arboris]
MKLIELTATENFGYRQFLVEGIRKHQDCFRSTPADQLNKPFPTNGTPDSFTLGILNIANELAGVVSFQREGQYHEKFRHKGLLFGMYVADKYSGQGLGRILLVETIRRVRLVTDLEQITLQVLANNSRAKRQYEKLGFRSFSFEKNAIKDGDMYYDEELMVLFMNNQSAPI